MEKSLKTFKIFMIILVPLFVIAFLIQLISGIQILNMFLDGMGLKGVLILLAFLYIGINRIVIIVSGDRDIHNIAYLVKYVLVVIALFIMVIYYG